MNVPIEIVGFCLAHFILPRHHCSSQRQKIDYNGIICFTVALLSLALAVNSAQTRGWDAPLVIAELVLGVVCLGWFVVIEHKASSPMINLNLFRRYPLIAGNATAFLAYYALFTVLFLLPFYFEDVTALHNDDVGLAAHACSRVDGHARAFRGQSGRSVWCPHSYDRGISFADCRFLHADFHIGRNEIPCC